MKEIKSISNPEDKLECYRLTNQILSNKLILQKLNYETQALHNALLKKCRDIEAKAGEGYKITPEFDCVKEGVSYGNNNDDNKE